MMDSRRLFVKATRCRTGDAEEWVLDTNHEITAEDLNRIRQWYNAVQDLNPRYLEDADRELIARLLTPNP